MTESPRQVRKLLPYKTLRSTHKVNLDNMADALVQWVLGAYDGYSPEELPTSIRSDDVLIAVRNSYARHGSDNIWAWADEFDHDEAKAYRAWAKKVVLEHWPEMDPRV